jgi:phosphatidate cytidylyltransferase
MFMDSISGESRDQRSHLDDQALKASHSRFFMFSCRGPNPSKLIQQFLTLRPDQQLHIFNTLKSHLTDKGILTATIENE